MGHIELRDLDDDDLDAVFALFGDDGAAALAQVVASGTNDRAAFEAWLSRAASQDAVWVVTEDGGFAGVAGVFGGDDERELTFAIASHARGRGVGDATLQLLTAREPIRPLYARIADADAPSEAVRERLGWSEWGEPASGPVHRYVLMPTLE